MKQISSDLKRYEVPFSLELINPKKSGEASGEVRVYKGYRIHDLKRVALKASEYEKGRLLEVADLLQTISTTAVPHFLPYYGRLLTERSTIIISDWVNDTLGSSLTGRAPFSLEEISTIAGQLFETLSRLKELKIVYGNLTPDNIAFDRTSQQAKLMDSVHMQTESEAMKDLPLHSYTAPEIFLGAPTYDGTIDVWGLGCILYELYTGANIVAAPKGAAILRKDPSSIFFNILAKFGIPPASYLNNMPHKERYFKQSLEGRWLPKKEGWATFPWKEKIERTRQERRDLFANVNPFIDLLEKIFRYENRISFAEALKHPFLGLLPVTLIPPTTPSFHDQSLLFVGRDAYFHAQQTGNFSNVPHLNIPLNGAPLDCVPLPRVENSAYLVTLVNEETIPEDLLDRPFILHSGSVLSPAWEEISKPAEPFCSETDPMLPPSPASMDEEY